MINCFLYEFNGMEKNQMKRKFAFDGAKKKKINENIAMTNKQ